MILYQDNILDHINTFTLDTLPHTILIKGDVGSGKHLISNYISDKFGLEQVDITNNLNLDMIMNIYLTTQPKCYIINSDDISVKEQNVILKLLEEPNSITFVILLSSIENLLDTIKNRCYLIKLNPYTKEQLKSFTKNCSFEDILLPVCTTPGQVLEYINEDFESMYEFANRVFLHIKTANVANILTIPNKVYFTDKLENKYNIMLFSKLLLFIAKKQLYDVYILTNNYYKELFIPHVNKKNLFEKYLMELKYTIQ